MKDAQSRVLTENINNYIKLAPLSQRRGGGCCTEDGRLLQSRGKRVEVERTDWLTLPETVKDWPSVISNFTEPKNRNRKVPD
jgi:hypothetical protein